jgi:D-sedoheptulose 7-phosphate isomerase
MDNKIKDLIKSSISVKESLLKNPETLYIIKEVVEVVTTAFQNGNRVYFCGNGGSAADAQHLAAEFVSKLARDRAPLPAEALTTDSSILTAIGNDYGFENVFSRQLAGKARSEDVFLGITTSGKSPNIISALEQCRLMGLKSIVFCGNKGGKAIDLADHCIVVPGAATSTIQELHIVLAHTLCECVEVAMFGE